MLRAVGGLAGFVADVRSTADGDAQMQLVNYDNQNFFGFAHRQADVVES